MGTMDIVTCFLFFKFFDFFRDVQAHRKLIFCVKIDKSARITAFVSYLRKQTLLHGILNCCSLLSFFLLER
jgi:hypothetical protein